MTSKKQHTAEPWTTNGFNLFGPPDAQSRHSNGLTLVGGVVDDANDWRGRPIGDPIERAEFREERLANAARIVECVNALAGIENPAEWVARAKKALGE